MIDEKKALLVKNQPEIVILNEITDVSDKLSEIKDCLVKIDSKEVSEYYEEISELSESLESLKAVLEGKELGVNISMEEVANNLSKVESAVKNTEQAMKNIKIPTHKNFPNKFSLNETQINELLLAVQSIPPFPVDDLVKAIDAVGKKIELIKIEKPEFNTKLIELKLDSVVKAIKSINISVSGGGGGIPSQLISGNSLNVNLETLPGFQIPNYDYIEVTYPVNTTEVYTYKTGGSGGTTVATITVVYTTSTKDVL